MNNSIKIFIILHQTQDANQDEQKSLPYTSIHFNMISNYYKQLCFLEPIYASQVYKQLSSNLFMHHKFTNSAQTKKPCIHPYFLYIRLIPYLSLTKHTTQMVKKSLQIIYFHQTLKNRVVNSALNFAIKTKTTMEMSVTLIQWTIYTHQRFHPMKISRMCNRQV